MFSHLRKLSILRGWNSNRIGRNLNGTLRFSSAKNITTSQVTKPIPVTFCYTKPNLLPGTHKRLMSYDSSNKTHQIIHNLITSSNKNVFVFMKGVPREPSCAYSEILIRILNEHQIDYDYANVLDKPHIVQEQSETSSDNSVVKQDVNFDLLQGLATYTGRPNVPQLFIDGKFVADFDEIIDMEKSGKLQYLLNKSKASNSEHAMSRNVFQQEQENVPEEEFVLSTLTRKELLPEVPLISLGLDKRIQKVKKPGSLTVDMFAGNYDDDFLTFPDPLESIHENQQLQKQAMMVQQMWPQIWNDSLQLHKFNFYNLFQLSVNEMMIIFEGIGRSMRSCCGPDDDLTTNDLSLVTKSIISLITRNCLTYWPLKKSNNYKIKELLPKNDILFGGASIDDNSQPHLPIGFCWTEMAPTLGSLPPQEWLSYGMNGGDSTDAFLIKGIKHKVLTEEPVENYLIYFKDKMLAEKYNQDMPKDEPNPAADPFVGCCLVHKSNLKFGPVYQDSAGINYMDIEFDTVVDNSRIVFPPERRNPLALNIKALGQLASSAVMIGLLKDILSKTYVYLIRSKKGLLTCDVVESKLASITSKIFALESVLYYIAGFFDGYDDSLDAHMEAAILKVMTNDYAFEIIRDIQQICGSEMFILSKLQDQINIFDSFLDGNIHNRLYIASMGAIWFARSKNVHLNQLRLAPWYPGYFVRHQLKETVEERDWISLDADIYGNLHPSLKEAGITLEYIIKRVKWATEHVCMKHGSNVTGAQSDLIKLSQLSIDALALTAMCARASKSYCNGTRNSELDVAITTDLSNEMHARAQLYIDSLKRLPISAYFNRSSEINQFNIKYGGYYSASPLDPNI